MQSCSKAPWGLLVLAWSDGIFTANARSPRPSSRQCPHDYSIRAGLNLPDKEFRYLRTIIVIAAVHRGFSSNREVLPLTFLHWAGVSPYTSAFAFAETYVFGKQFRGLFSCGPIIKMTIGLLRVKCLDKRFKFFNKTGLYAPWDLGGKIMPPNIEIIDDVFHCKNRRQFYNNIDAEYLFDR